jgi:hypothetical protein
MRAVASRSAAFAFPRPRGQAPGRHGRCRRLQRVGGGHGIWVRVMWPARSAGRCAASQACRAARDSAANRFAAAVSR